VENSITYYYYVTALKDSTESSASSEVSGNPTAEEPNGDAGGDGSSGCFISEIMRNCFNLAGL